MNNSTFYDSTSMTVASLQSITLPDTLCPRVVKSESSPDTSLIQLQSSQKSISSILGSTKIRVHETALFQDISYRMIPSSANTFFYAFNILPINLTYLQNGKNFSFLSYLDRSVDLCTASKSTGAVHVQYNDTVVSMKTASELVNGQLECASRMEGLMNILRHTAQFNFMQNSGNSQQQLPFQQIAQHTLNNFFAAKKGKRMFALSSAFDARTLSHKFAAHFSSEMIQTLGYEDSDSFLLQSSTTGLNEFFMKTDFTSNMQTLIEGLQTIEVSQQLNQQQSQQQQSIRIKQQFCTRTSEVMEAMFIVYYLPTQQQASAQKILVFELQHILDFSVPTKGRRITHKKRVLDQFEEQYLNHFMQSASNNAMNIFQSSSCSNDESQAVTGISASPRIKKSISKPAQKKKSTVNSNVNATTTTRQACW